MKILHALVGYLAVTALPFHSFAFASPLAGIDYDGYLNITQNHIDSALMKHALGTIVETCQTVTTSTQNHKDTALMKRRGGPGDIIEARQGELAVPLAFIVTVIVAGIFLKLIWFNDDDKKRVAFTQGSISGTISKYPKFNWVICHSPYSIKFDGVEGRDYGHTHHELKVSWGKTIGYDLYWARSGTFYRYGDGGFINWAYSGNIVGIDDGGGTIHFGTIS